MKTLTYTVTKNSNNEIVVTCDIRGKFGATIVYDRDLRVVRSLCSDDYHLMQFEAGAARAAGKAIREARAA